MASSAEAATVAAYGDHRITLAPVRGRARIESLDVLRGFAILAIFYMNIPDMAGPLWLGFADPRAFGMATPADTYAFYFIRAVLDGTQRGLLEMLFGAGMLIMARRAMEPDGPVAVADLFQRRNLWLLFFGLCDVFLLMWYGDIIHVYALTALGLFCFRRLPARTLLMIGLAFATVQVFTGPFGHNGTLEYVERQQLIGQVQRIEALSPERKADLDQDDKATLQLWRELQDQVRPAPDPQTLAWAKEEKAARTGSYADYAMFNWTTYIRLTGMGVLLFSVVEAAFTMLVGMALFKWGVLQGQRSARFYAALLVPCYVFGMGVRLALAHFTLNPDVGGTIAGGAEEYARLAVTLGHVCLFNLLLKARAGRILLSPLKAAGQLAFTLYFMQQIIGIQIMFSPIGLRLPMAPGWATLMGWATIVFAILLVFANIWVRLVGMGPMEWLLRSLSYGQKQPWKVREG